MKTTRVPVGHVPGGTRNMTALRKNKFQLPNLGVPIFCDPEQHLSAVPKATQESWYVKFTFEADGKQIGLVWHQQVTGSDANSKSCFGEVILVEGTEKVWIPKMIDGPATGEIGSSDEECHVWSSYGALKGGRDRLELALSHDRGAVDLVLTPRSEVLYNGTTGLLALMGGESYQFAFPNMDVQGTVTIDGTVYEVPEGTTAWFDRQWGFSSPDLFSPKGGKQLPAWLWIGTPINEAGTAAISLWDTFFDGTRRSFATILDENGLQYNVLAEVGYDQIWTSERTGNSYPREVHVSVPSVDLTLSFTALLDEPVYDHGGEAINGCMSLSTMSGSYRGSPIDGHYILEMIGDLCG